MEKTKSLFGNGVLKNSGTWSNFSLAASKEVTLGRAMNRDRYSNLYIDEVHFLKRALTEEEIACEYYSGMYKYSTDAGSSWSDWVVLPPSAQSCWGRARPSMCYSVARMCAIS